MPHQPWTLEADEVLALPLDELALRVLQDADANEESNWRNWMLSAAQGPYRKQPQVLRALSEAWTWLHNHGLVIWNPDKTHADSIAVSRKGREVIDRGLPWLRAVERLDVQLVPELEYTARPQFLRGDFETAAFVAMKEVEVQVRTRAAFDDSMIGVSLMRKAFGTNGPLWRTDLNAGESVGLMDLFAGAVGLFKNPSSHRRVDLNDPTEAAEIVLLADLLLRLLAKIEEPQTDPVSE